MGNCLTFLCKSTRDNGTESNEAKNELAGVKTKAGKEDSNTLKTKLLKTDSEPKKAKEITPKVSACGIKDSTIFTVFLGNGTGVSGNYWGLADEYEMTMDEIKANLYEIAYRKFQSEIDDIKDDFRRWITNLSPFVSEINYSKKKRTPGTFTQDYYLACNITKKRG